MKINVKIAGLLFLLLMSVFILYLSFNIDDKQAVNIKSVEITGGACYTDNDYAAFAMLKDSSVYPFLTPAIIKDRIEKHPYVEKADVKMEGLNKVTVAITEKKFSAMLIDSTRQILITDKLQYVPCMPSSVGLNFPVISNADNTGGVKYFSSARYSSEILTAFRIIEVFKMTNEELANNLSQIDLRNGKDILVYFSNINFPVVFGRKDEIKKAVYFNNLWKFMKGNDINNYLDYVDLRFDKHVFLGVTEGNSGKEGQQI